nr:DegV family EDD domain-containing protein [Gemmatimonadota bacterium]MYH53192.1 DegV family EDD domain-containing protein [Gemmatimonadota bacterium]MYK65215.1 DegV family EDD domain-containing protein [Gemmatimonadota bacterium]
MSDRSRIAYVDGPRLRRALLAACRSGRQCKAELNRINVFPVADGDTGTNLSLTLEAVAGELARYRERRVDRVAAAAARSALLGARGNCGMMLSQFLLGFSGGLEGRARASLGEVASALTEGAQSLDAAVENPVEGTILTVVRDSASKAVSESVTKGSGDFAEAMVAMRETARESLARTPDLLPVLAEAGVVDAGAQGFVEMVEGVVRLIEKGDEGVEAEAVAGNGAEEDVHPEWSPIGAAEHPFTHGSRRYCTEILVEGPDLPGEGVVREALAEGSEELLVIRSEEILKIHLHTDHPRDAIDYCATLGTVVAHKAEDMLAQFEAARIARGKTVRRPVGIMVDSGSDLPDAVARAHGIHIIPLLLIDGERTLKDRIDISAGEFHAQLESGGPLPTTSQPPPGDFIAAYEHASTEAEVVVPILLAASLSGVFRSAENAKDMVPHLDVRLVDSKGASILVGLLALKAAELAEAGADAEEIIAEVERIRAQSGILFTVRNLDRLIASGRVSQFAGWLGGVLDLKPVLGLGGDGTVKAFGKARGAARAKKLILDTVAAAIPPGAKRVRFGVIHAAAPEMAEQLRGELAARYEGAEILVAPITPVIATHLGPGAWGIAYTVED